MRVLKNIFSQLHTFLLWAILCVLLWGWIYTFVGDTSRDKKVTVFINAVAIEDQKLALRLEERKPDGIKMIKVHDFGYDMFGTATPGDIFMQSFEAPEGIETFVRGGKCLGMKIYDAKTGKGAGAGVYIRYAPFDGTPAEDYYLCFGSETWHLDGAKEAKDNAAWEVAMELLSLD